MRFFCGVLAVLLVGTLLAGCSNGGSTTSVAAPTPSPAPATGTMQSIDQVMTQAVVQGTSTGQINPCSPGSFGYSQQISGSTFSVTIAPAACVILGFTVNGNPSISFSGTINGTGGTASGSGTGPVGGFTATGNGQSISCTIPPPGQTFTFSSGGLHGSQTGGPVICNGITYMLPSDSW